jgi:gamma-glutamyltranspeptidase/glutathione hydrolase
MVACPEPLAAEVGAGILGAGGNAADAAVATAFAQAVTNPLISSLAGCGGFLVHDAKSAATEVIAAYAMSGSRALPGVYKPVAGDAIPGVVGGGGRVEGDRNMRGHASSMVPSLVRGLEAVHRRHGHLPWRALIEPAARLARDGIEVGPYLYRTWDPDRVHPDGLGIPEKIEDDPEARKIFMPNGRLLKLGERLVQRDLARTLDRIAEDGAQIFYEGEIGEAMMKDFGARGGLFTSDDLRACNASVLPPLRSAYRDWTVVTDGPPTLGVVQLQIMRVLEGIDLRRLGWNTPEYLDLVVRTMQFAFVDAAEVLGSDAPDPAGVLLDPARIAARRERVQAGDSPRARAVAGRDGTTHLAVVDSDRNVMSWVHSSGSGSGSVTPGLGFVHNNHMLMFDTRTGGPQSIAPRKVPVHGGGPVIVERDGRPVLAIGSPAGGLKTTAITQVLLNMFEFGIPLQAAISAPRVHTQPEGVVMVEPSFPSGLRRALERAGHRIVVSEYTARVSAIELVNGDLVGGADPRGGGGLEWV